jgi:hypothetical protein
MSNVVFSHTCDRIAQLMTRSLFGEIKNDVNVNINMILKIPLF